MLGKLDIDHALGLPSSVIGGDEMLQTRADSFIIHLVHQSEKPLAVALFESILK